MACAALPIASPGRVTSPYGWRNRPSGRDLHTGVDLGAPQGTPVYAMLPARVRLAARSGELQGYGNSVVLEHTPQLFTLYAHLQGFSVMQGQHVDAGQQIGTVGRTAGTREQPDRVFDVSGAHLHLEFLDRWPPRGRDLDRLDPATVLGELGVIVPPSGPLVQACTGAPWIAAFVPEGSSSSSSLSKLAPLLLLLAAAWATKAFSENRKGASPTTVWRL
jgi:murein DD-endopeptidase MepM/ murein hydrolase activator NlpD